MQRHDVIQNGLLDFHEKTRQQGIAFRRGEAPQFVDIIAGGEVGDVSHHRRAHPSQVNVPNPEVPEPVIALNIA